MKLLNKVMVVTLFVYLCSSVASCDACCLDKDIKQLKTEIKQANELMPDLLQAVDSQALDVEDPEDRELQQFVTQVSVPALAIFNQVFKLLRANPWMEKASKPLMDEIRQSNPELLYTGANQTEQCEKVQRLMSLYTEKLGEHHPQPCPNCKGGLLQKAGRCHFLHEEHETMLPLLDCMRTAAGIESRYPGVSSKYQKLVSDVRKSNTTPAKHRALKYRKIESGLSVTTQEVKDPR